MESNVYLRQAGREDVEIFFKWVNEPAVRANSFNTEPISWESHQKWFETALADDGVRIYVLMQDSIPVGQVRLVFEDSSDVDVAIEPLAGDVSVQIAELRDILEESTIPYNVNVVDMSNAADTLCEEIRREGIVWKKA